jgi:CHASE2 domain-containing sensor protein
MSETSRSERKASTAALWGLLAVLLVLGTVALATFVYGLLGLLAGGWLDLVPLVGGAFGSFLVFLLTAGILYRVDRYRGAAKRRVELFE